MRKGRGAPIVYPPVGHDGRRNQIQVLVWTEGEQMKSAMPSGKGAVIAYSCTKGGQNHSLHLWLCGRLSTIKK